MKNTQFEIAELLLELGAVKLDAQNLFTYASGLKGPIYCDNRLILGHPRARRVVRDHFYRVIQNQGLYFQAILAMATGGIAHGAWLADKCDVPLGYIRSKAKGYGKAKVVEGIEPKRQKAIIIEDLINQGSSLARGFHQTRDLFDIQYAVSIVDYQMERAKRDFETLGLRSLSLTNLDALSEIGVKMGYISTKDIEVLQFWRKDPKRFSQE